MLMFIEFLEGIRVKKCRYIRNLNIIFCITARNSDSEINNELQKQSQLYSDSDGMISRTIQHFSSFNTRTSHRACLKFFLEIYWIRVQLSVTGHNLLSMI
ncbi:hypothetical protein R3W88_005549 [Solanum pinnatisectum]|uniref:Uncharacterized protein n=1 Tax=Solanum pinnatisectum TaxID=50273 RepID=A0AAV9KCS4_9SOLN|nr:hypothetical protein R3W88_005549 [Solanum pinnatisectum]